MKKIKFFFLAITTLALSACELPVQQMGPRERGIVFRRLPTFLGGGVSTGIVPGGAMAYIMPWDSVVRFDTGSTDVLLGEGGEDEDLGGFLFTRAKDGNEVALKMTVRYRIRDEASSLANLVQTVGKSNQEIGDLVVAISRAQVRQHMNDLRTSEFLREVDRYRGVGVVQKAIQAELDILAPNAIEILAVMLDRFEFARQEADGKIDRSYQDKLNEVLRILEQTEREQLRIATVKAEGEQREFVTQAAVNRVVQEALGIQKQSELRGTAYLTSKQNEAKGILALGKGEVQGLIEKINALEGPGGSEILKLDLARYLQESGSRFILMGAGDSEKSLGVQRTDTNELLNQMGVFEAMRDQGTKTAKPTAKVTKPAPQISDAEK